MLSPQECCSTSELCSALNQLPERKPSCLTPFTRLIPAANSGLSKPESAAFVSEAPHGCELLVDGVSGQMPRFQVHAVANDYDAVEGQPRLGAVPGDELVDGILVDAARCR